MIDLLYSYRRRQLTMADCKTDVETYLSKLSSVKAVQWLNDFMSSFPIGVKTVNEVVTELRSYMLSIMESTTYKPYGIPNTLSGDILEIISVFKTDYLARAGSYDPRMYYVVNYICWFYEACHEIVSCIVNNGSINELELVGVRTKEYLNVMGLSDIDKRFGQPNKREALPLSFKYGNFVIGPPPMTTAVHTRASIDSVYKLFGYSGFYEVKINKTTFARPKEFQYSVGRYFPVDTMKSQCSKISDESDIVTSLVYDIFSSVYLEGIKDLFVDTTTVLSDLNNSLIAGVKYVGDDKFVGNLVYDKYGSLPQYLTMVY